MSGLGVRCHLSSVRCQVSSLWCQVSPVNYHLSEKAKTRATDKPSRQVSYVTCHVSGIMRQVSCVKFNMSGVTCQVSHVTDHVSHVIYSFFPSMEDPKFLKYVIMHVRIISHDCFFLNFGNFASFHVFHDFSTDSPCPTPSHQLLFS